MACTRSRSTRTSGSSSSRTRTFAVLSRGNSYSINEGNHPRWTPQVQRWNAWIKGEDKQTGRPYGHRYVASLVADAHSAGFAGELAVRFDNPRRGESHDYTFELKNGLIRYAAPNPVRGAPAVAILDSATRKVVLLVDAQKSFLQVPLAEEEGSSDAGAAPTARKTGARENVSGYDCEAWEATRGAHKLTACVYEGIRYFDVARVAGSGVLAGAWSWKFEGTRSLPLRMAEYDEQGKLVARMETTKLDRHAVPPADFTVPGDFTEVRPPPRGRFAEARPAAVNVERNAAS